LNIVIEQGGILKTLVVYYSKSGTTKEIAEMITAGLVGKGMAADMEAIIDLEKRDGALSVVKNGAHSSMKRSTNIEEPKHDPAAYDLTVICSPVWAWKITPAARAYCRKMKGKLNQTAYVLTGAGDVSEKTWATFTEEAGKPAARLGISADDRKAGIHAEKVEQFVKEITNV
jgi:flavodoxin